ncbi:hypothetical protein JCM3770_003133 [Rhodotorula araucariae]
MEGHASTSVLGFRPWTGRFPDDENFRFSPVSTATATSTQVPHIPTKALGSPYLVSEDSPRTSVLTIVLPLLFGALALLGCVIAVIACLGHRARNNKATARLKKRRAVDQEAAAAELAQWGSRRADMAQIELDDFDRQTLHSLRIADDLARARYAESYKTHDLPRKPPPAYEP